MADEGIRVLCRMRQRRFRKKRLQIDVEISSSESDTEQHLTAMTPTASAATPAADIIPADNTAAAADIVTGAGSNRAALDSHAGSPKDAVTVGASETLPTTGVGPATVSRGSM